MFDLTLEEIESIENLIDGNHSVIYSQIKDRLSDYTDRDLPFRGEFLFFENRYLKIMKHMIRRRAGVNKIVDIGCQFGFQSEWLKGLEYIGIDCLEHRFFNQGQKGVQYIVGTFPDIDIDLSDSAVISSMSLGYFNNLVSDDNDEAIRMIIRGLSDCRYLYIATSIKMAETLKTVYDRCEILEEYGEFTLYYFEKDSTELKEPINVFQQDPGQVKQKTKTKFVKTIGMQS